MMEEANGVCENRQKICEEWQMSPSNASVSESQPLLTLLRRVLRQKGLGHRRKLREGEGDNTNKQGKAWVCESQTLDWVSDFHSDDA